MEEKRMSDELRQRLARGTYRVDSEAVAEAVMRRWLALPGSGVLASQASGEGSVGARQLEGRSSSARPS